MLLNINIIFSLVMSYYFEQMDFVGFDFLIFQLFLYNVDFVLRLLYSFLLNLLILHRIDY